MARRLGPGDDSCPHPGVGDRGRRRTRRPVAEEHAVPGLPRRRPAHRRRSRLDGAHGSRAGRRGAGPAGGTRWRAGSAAQYAQVRPHPATSPRPGGGLRPRCAHGPGFPAVSARTASHRRRDDGRRGAGGMADGHGDARTRPLLRGHPRLLGRGGAMARREVARWSRARGARSVLRDLQLGTHAGRAAPAPRDVAVGRARRRAAVQRGQHSLARCDPGTPGLRSWLATSRGCPCASRGGVRRRPQ